MNLTIGDTKLLANEEFFPDKYVKAFAEELAKRS